MESFSEVDITISKFDDFWKDVLSKHHTVLNNLDKQIPIFKSLLKTLDSSEKERFKPFMQIIAHSLQFLKKIVSLDESYHTEQEKLTTFAKLTNDSLQTSEKMDKNKNEFLQTTADTLQNDLTKYKIRESEYKAKIKQLESDFDDLESRYEALSQDSTTKELQVVKADKIRLEEEVEELQERCDTLIVENDGYKKQVTQLITKIKENEKTIERIQARIESEDMENQIDVLKSTNTKLREEILNKENEVNSQRTEIKNLQEALTELEESTDFDQNKIIVQKQAQLLSVSFTFML
jgi:chromosome segregation ATPase